MPLQRKSSEEYHHCADWKQVNLFGRNEDCDGCQCHHQVPLQDFRTVINSWSNSLPMFGRPHIKQPKLKIATSDYGIFGKGQPLNPLQHPQYQVCTGFLIRSSGTVK